MAGEIRYESEAGAKVEVTFVVVEEDPSELDFVGSMQLSGQTPESARHWLREMIKALTIEVELCDEQIARGEAFYELRH